MEKDKEAQLAVIRGLKYTKYDCASHNGNLREILFPNGIGESTSDYKYDIKETYQSDTCSCYSGDNAFRL